MIGNRLKDILKEKQIKAADLSRMTGKSTGYISDLLSNKITPKIDIFSSICRVFKENNININPLWLLTGEGSMFLDEEEKTPQEYPELIENIKKTDLSEQEIIKLVNNYSKLPSKQAIDLLIEASQGDKTALVKLRQYIDALEMLFDK